MRKTEEIYKIWYFEGKAYVVLSGICEENLINELRFKRACILRKRNKK